MAASWLRGSQYENVALCGVCVTPGCVFTGRMGTAAADCTRSDPDAAVPISTCLFFAPGLNEELVQLLLIRDELHTEQDAMLVDIEDLTRSVWTHSPQAGRGPLGQSRPGEGPLLPCMWLLCVLADVVAASSSPREGVSVPSDFAQPPASPGSSSSPGGLGAGRLSPGSSMLVCFWHVEQLPSCDSS